MRELQLDIDAELARSNRSTGGRRTVIEQALRTAIRSGRLEPGTALPPSRVFASDLSVSRSTVVSAYEQLVAEGYLISKQGSATRVAQVRTEVVTSNDDNPLGRAPRYDLRPGEPDTASFPRTEWLRSLRTVLATAPDSALGYPDPRGRIELRHTIAAYLNRARTVDATAADVFVYGGFASAIGFLGEAFLRSGIQRVGIENPSLPLHPQILRLTGVTTVPIPVDDEGIDVAALEASGVDAVVTTPANQYPLGVTMTPTRRSELVAWARNGPTARWIVEDDYDGEFRYDRRPVGSLQGLAPDVVVYAGTTSKSLAAGLRLGWIVVPPGLRAHVMRSTHIRSGVSTIDQLALADFIERGALDRQVRSMRARYRQRRDRLIERLEAGPAWLDVPHTVAGLHLTVMMHSGAPDEHVVAERATERNVGLATLAMHFSSPATQSGLVVGFSRPNDSDFDTALDLLDEILRA